MDNMDNVFGDGKEISVTRSDEIKTLQNEILEIAGKVKEIGTEAINKAIRIGELLIEQRKELQDSNDFTFANWVDNNCNFSRMTAYHYIDLFNYQSQIQHNGSFVAAYAQISEIKENEQLLIESKAQERIAEYKETGKKPDGWRRGTDDKLLKKSLEDDEAEKERQEKIENLKYEQEKLEAEMKADKESTENLQERINESIHSEEAEEFARQAKAQLNEYNAETESWRQKLSDTGKKEPLFDALNWYIDGKKNVNESLAACQDIIKFCKAKATELNKKIYECA